MIARVIAAACLTALKWLFLFLCLLLVAVTIAQWWRGDPFAQPVTTSVAAGVCVLAALACGWAAGRFQRMG